MNLEVIGDKKFVNSIKKNNGLWVLVEGNSAYSIKSGNGVSLLVWNEKKEAEDFSSGENFSNLSPTFIPLDVFINVWLEPGAMHITEILATPRSGFEALSYTVRELIARLKT